MVAVVQQVKQTPMDKFLTRVEAKFRDLVSQSSDPWKEIEEAAGRMMEADLLFQMPDQTATPRQAAFQMFGDNEALTEIWPEWEASGTWEAASTPEEMVSALLPSHGM